MNVFRRAILYITKKKNKSILLFFIVFIMASLVLMGLSIKKATDISMANLRESMVGYFKIEEDKDNSNNWTTQKDSNGKTEKIYSGERVDDQLVKKVIADKDIKDYNGMAVFFLYNEKLKLEPGALQGSGRTWEKMPRFLSNTKSDLYEYFLTGAFELSKGSHIQPSDSGKAVISEAFAKYNNLDIGGKFTAQITSDIVESSSPAIGQTIEFEVKGIYKINRKRAPTPQTPESDLAENYIFTDSVVGHKVTSAIKGADTTRYMDGATFFVKDPKEINNIIDRLKASKVINTDTFKIVINDTKYEASAAPLEKMTGIISTLIIIIMAVCVLLLSLILTLWIKDRIHEIGIFLSIGISKLEIVGQHLIECMIIAVIAFCLSYPIASIAANNIGRTFVEMSSTAEEDAKTSEFDDDVKLDVSVGASEFFIVAALGTLVIVSSVTIASVTVIRLKPKNILSRMS